jgi:hypothetical protein
VSEDRAVHDLPQHVREYLERNGVRFTPSPRVL